MATYFNQHSDEEILLAMRYSGSGKPPPYSFLDLTRKLGGVIDVSALVSTLRRLEQEGQILVRGSTPESNHYWDRESLESGETATALCGWWGEFSQAVLGSANERSAEMQVLDAVLEEEEEDWDKAIAAPAPR